MALPKIVSHATAPHTAYFFQSSVHLRAVLPSGGPSERPADPALQPPGPPSLDRIPHELRGEVLALPDEALPTPALVDHARADLHARHREPERPAAAGFASAMGLRESVRGELVDSASRTEVHNEERGHGAPNSALTIPPQCAREARARIGARALLPQTPPAGVAQPPRAERAFLNRARSRSSRAGCRTHSAARPSAYGRDARGVLACPARAGDLRPSASGCAGEAAQERCCC